MTTAADIERLGAEPLDVLVTHEAPAGVPLTGFQLPPEDELHSEEVRRLVRAAVQVTRPQLVLHGHWHKRNSYELAWPGELFGQLEWSATQVEGLAADVQHDFQAWGVLELEPLSFSGGERYRV